MNDYDSKKLRGGYYTPKEISEYLANWSIRRYDDKILEPSCGDGNILEECILRLKKLNKKKRDEQNLIGVELDYAEAEKAKKRLSLLDDSEQRFSIINGDFFEYCAKKYFQAKSFDVVIGNPPFIRYQNFPDKQREIAFNLMRKVGLSPSKLTNSWLAFLVCATLLLKEDGRLAMVIPAELFQVNYAAEVRRYLSSFFKRIFIITFNKLVFSEVQQEITLLLCEKNRNALEGINVLEVDNLQDLKRLSNLEILREDIKPIDHNNDKWTQYFLSKDEILLLRDMAKHPELIMSGSAFDVDVGIVTGQNKYFVLTEKKAQKYGIESTAEKIVVRSNHLSGISFTNKDFDQNLLKDFPCLLFYPKNFNGHSKSKNIIKYIEYGESNNVNKGYKCSMRKPWYIVPSVWTPDAFMLRQVHGYSKLIVNNANALSTDTIHRARIRKGFPKNLLAVSFLNSLTFAFAEITGRSYGGGVLTFEPSECEKLPLPMLKDIKADFGLIDKLVRENKINEVLKINDREILQLGLGLSTFQIDSLNRIWRKLMCRRINRRK